MPRKKTHKIVIECLDISDLKKMMKLIGTKKNVLSSSEATELIKNNSKGDNTKQDNKSPENQNLFNFKHFGNNEQ